MVNELLQDVNSNPEHNVLVILVVSSPVYDRTRISQKLFRYLNWIGTNTLVFDIETSTDDDLAQKISSLQDGVDVAILKAASTSVEKRNSLRENVGKFENVQLMYVILNRAIGETEASSPDNEGNNNNPVIEESPMNQEHGVKDYKKIVISKVGKEVTVHYQEDPTQSKIVDFLSKIQLQINTVYFSRHGESEYNIENKLGGDSSVSDKGYNYSKKIANFFLPEGYRDMEVWTSTKKRTLETVYGMDNLKVERKELDELYAGDYEGLTHDQVEKDHPEEFNKRSADKFNYGYPNGESYKDLISRLEKLVVELESKPYILVVAHQAILRCIFGYYMGTELNELPFLDVPLHTIFKLKYGANGDEIELHHQPDLDFPCVREEVFV